MGALSRGICAGGSFGVLWVGTHTGPDSFLTYVGYSKIGTIVFSASAAEVSSFCCVLGELKLTPGKPLTPSQVLIPEHLSASTPCLNATHPLCLLSGILQVSYPKSGLPGVVPSLFQCHPLQAQVDLVPETCACSRARESISRTNPAALQKRHPALPADSRIPAVLAKI